MKKAKKLVSLILALNLLLLCVVSASAETASNVRAYGFDVPSSGYKYALWKSKTALNVYTDTGVLIGKTTYVAVRARSNNASNGKYYDCMLLRSQMEPIVTKSGTTYYRGLNNMNRAEMSLNNRQEYVNIFPKATMPTSSSTWNCSFGISGGTGNSGNSFGFSIGTGYSSTTQDNCFTVSSNYYSGSKKYDVKYNYSVSANVISTAARKAMNLWCTNTHQCFYGYSYTTPTNNTANLTVKYTSNFRYAMNRSSTWDGSTWDVVINTAGRTETRTYSYQGSN